MLLWAKKRLRYLLRATFSTDMAAPLTSPWEGLTLVQTDGQFSTSGGKLNFPAQATPAWGDQALYDAVSRTRVAGRALSVDVVVSSTGTFIEPIYWSSSTTLGSPEGFQGIEFRASAALCVTGIGGSYLVVGTYAASTTYQLAVILRTTGAFYIIKGGAFVNWTLLWVSNTLTTTPVYPVFTNYDASGTLDNFRIPDTLVFPTDTSLYTNRLAAPAAGATTASTADTLIEFTFIYNGTPCYFQYRTTDALNGWEVDADSGTLTLNKVVAGGYTAVATVGSTFTATNTYRVVIVVSGNIHKVYTQLSGVVTLRTTYTDATNYLNTATRIEADAVSASMSEVIAWPLNPTVPNV